MSKQPFFNRLKLTAQGGQGDVAVDLVENLHNQEGGGLGLVAARDLLPNEYAVRIPESMMLSWNNANRDVKRHAKLLLQKSEGSTSEGKLSQIILATVFIQELRKKTDSTFADYFGILPTKAPYSYPNWPSEWRLTVDNIIWNNATGQKFASWANILRLMGKALHPNEPFSELEIRRVMGLIESRSSNGNMIPLVDLGNHAFDPTCELGCEDGFCFLQAVRPVARGEEITYEYKDLGNVLLLTGYGFHLDANPYTSIRLIFPGMHAAHLQECQNFHKGKTIPFLLDGASDAILPPKEEHCLRNAFQKSPVPDAKAAEEATTYLRSMCTLMQEQLALAWGAAKNMRAKARNGELSNIGVQILKGLEADRAVVTRCVRNPHLRNHVELESAPKPVVAPRVAVPLKRSIEEDFAARQAAPVVAVAVASTVFAAFWWFRCHRSKPLQHKNSNGARRTPAAKAWPAKNNSKKQ